MKFSHTGKNLFSLHGTPAMKTSFSLWEKLHRENPVFITGMGLQCYSNSINSWISSQNPWWNLILNVLILDICIMHGILILFCVSKEKKKSSGNLRGLQLSELKYFEHGAKPITSELDFLKIRFVHWKCIDYKSNNLQYHTLGLWVAGTNDSSTKRLMFHVLSFFITSCENLCENRFNLFFYFLIILQK